MFFGRFAVLVRPQLLLQLTDGQVTFLQVLWERAELVNYTPAQESKQKETIVKIIV